MLRYYCDVQKTIVRGEIPDFSWVRDEEAQQSVKVVQNKCGSLIAPEKCWSPFCKELFLKEKADHLELGGFGLYPPWEGDLGFLRDLPQCKCLTIKFQKPIDLSVLKGNPHIESLQLYYAGKGEPGEFDFTSMPNLKMSIIPVCSSYKSVLRCGQLVSLGLCFGKYAGVLDLSDLFQLEELLCISVSLIKGIMLHPKVRLRALWLENLRLFDTLCPLDAVTEELRVVNLNRTPKLRSNIEWLARAKNVECISLWLGPIPTISFLKGLKKLQVLELFGSKVLDRDLSILKSLRNNRLDTRLWSEK
jgi:hypothetical protein